MISLCYVEINTPLVVMVSLGLVRIYQTLHLIIHLPQFFFLIMKQNDSQT